MNHDWDAVASAINTRMAELGLTQAELAARARVSVAGLRQIQRAIPKRRQPRTLSAISVALDWPPRHLEQTATGASAGPDDGDRLGQLEAEVTELRERVDSLEDRQA